MQALLDKIKFVFKKSSGAETAKGEPKPAVVKPEEDYKQDSSSRGDKAQEQVKERLRSLGYL